PFENSANVRELIVDARHRRGIARAGEQQRLRGFGEREEIARVRFAKTIELAGCDELLRRKLPYRFEQAIARFRRGAIADDERLVDERGEEIEDRVAREEIIGADRLGGVECEVGMEDCEAAKEELFLFAEQAKTPVDRF